MSDVSKEGVKFVGFNEGCKLKAYRDVAGVLTIGYGHTGKDVHEGMVITQEEAEELLKTDLTIAVLAVNRLVKVPLSQNQFDSLVDFVFNVGVQAFKTSSLLRELNDGEYGPAAEQFLRWKYAGGKLVSGLLERRKREKELFEYSKPLDDITRKTAVFKWLTDGVKEIMEKVEKPASTALAKRSEDL